MKILIIGANGQLGSEIQDLSTNYVKNDFIFKDLPELDICNFKLLNDYISYNKIDVVINCAAYTDVDKAEEEVEISKKVNTLGVKHLVASIENIQGELVHLSTDYVFNGKKLPKLLFRWFVFVLRIFGGNIFSPAHFSG